MKRKIIASLLGLAAVAVAQSSFGQGTVYFANYVFTDHALTAVVTRSDNGLTVGNTFKADLLFHIGAATGNVADYTLAAGSQTTFNGSSDGDAAGFAGYFFGPSVTIPGYSSGPISFIVEAFNGVDYGTSQAKGRSAEFTLPSISAGNPAPPVGDLFNSGVGGPFFQAFTVAVPEPTTLSLIGLGVGAFALIRRRK